MNGHPTNEEREALIAGERADALTPGEAGELSLLAGLLGDPSTWAEPPAGLEDAIVQAVEQAPPDAGTESIPSTTHSTRRDAAPRRRRVGWLAAPAAAAAIAAVIGIAALTGTGGNADFSANLASTAAAPGARATASIAKTDAGFRVVLDAHGLPKLPAGEYYQAWLKNSQGTLVPIGTFSSSDGRVTLWSGVSPKEYDAISVTIEAADGDQSSSGNKVLTGEVHR